MVESERVNDCLVIWNAVYASVIPGPMLGDCSETSSGGRYGTYGSLSNLLSIFSAFTPLQGAGLSVFGRFRLKLSLSLDVKTMTFLGVVAAD